METTADQYFKNTGTTQSGRFLDALHPEYVKIDERSFEDLLVFTSKLSKLINFYNKENKIDGDWSYFFSDETVILATIIDSEPAEIEEKFKSFLLKASQFKQPERRYKYTQKCFYQIYRMASRFGFWYNCLKAVEEFTMFQVSIRNEIFNAINSRLAKSLREFKFIVESYASEAPAQNSITVLDFSQFDEIWKLNGSAPDDEPMPDFGNQSFEELSERLQQIFQSFYETLLYLKSKTPDYLNQSMQSDIHYPEIALFLTFLKLHTYAQENLNQITSRHINFYYTSILRQLVKNAVPDKIYLQFIPDEGAIHVEIPKGTKFIGEHKEFNEDLVYETDHDLLVNKTQIKQLKTIYVDSTYLNVKGRPKYLVKNILQADLPSPGLLEANKDKTLLKKSYPAFGEDQNGKGKNEKTMSNAEVGFAISSPSLFLKQGYREIETTFFFSPSSFHHLTGYLHDLSVSIKDDIDELFVKVFPEAFHISVTTSAGWLLVKKHVVTLEENTHSLKISFDLTNSDAAIVGFDKAQHSGNYSTSLPVVRFFLNSETFVYGYSLLSKLVLEQVFFNTKVSGAKDLLLHNNIGQLSPTTPFLPFGPMPKAGAYFIVGSDEIFNKPLDDLKINIDWFDLPANKFGFAGHYEAYNLDITNNSFEAGVSVLDNGRWKPAAKEEQQPLKLFRTADKGKEANPSDKGALLSSTVFANIDIKKINQPSDYDAINKPLELSPSAQRGFIKLELSNPRFGFGHDVYPAILSEIAMENARGTFLKTKKKEKKDLPNAPYAPQIQSISIDYSSSSAISLVDRSQKIENTSNNGELFYIHPFGIHKAYPDNAKQEVYLLPDYHFEGCLLLGLSNLNPPQTITILVEMIDEYTESSEQDPPVVEWSYLAKDEWCTLAPSKILKDETNSFLKTGIIILDMPYGITKGNTLLDPALFWIRATAVKNVKMASGILSVATQVVTATLDNENLSSARHLHKPLPANTIKRSAKNITGIQTVKQPLPSFKGLPEESRELFHTRVAERLHHKQRAVTKWDFERIILEKFPEVNRATCLPNMTSNSTSAPGNVLIVVTPYNDQSANPNEPMADSELLYRIKTYIKEFTSPFVKIEVRNPHYERIKIICAVKFTDGYNYGFYIQKLNEQINKYLTGTLLTQTTKVELGGSIHSSDILSFMRTLPYVHFITKFSMVQVARNVNGLYQLIDTARENELKSSLRATKPWSVLVPAPEHQISVLVEKSEERSRQAGIDYLELGHDFIIEE